MYVLDNNAELDWQFQWHKWLEADETIIGFVITTELEVGAGMKAPKVIDDGKTVLFWLSGAKVGGLYKVANRITTSKGRVDERTILIRVVER